ncbi:flagellar hook-filament junction [Exiguobacterium sp. 8H]|uniref:flagellar hook-associated protein FlgK n=1 Tax=unclassified Exiguobacterium TaxID=2644629 RepID=UPI0012EF8B49|nr:MULTISPECIES: flagellar hook-associated protein FlgK [unclassified Exiguobacterium]VXB48014.1 flagellar hook-filament junction [Exiguobacterium sp. 8A]VXB49623.1 flagellar hook-filament junction [Exiguobacterium sp. 8H]
MGSTFMGLETARRSLSTHQWALQATGNNVANASNPGYSRQRLTLGMTEQLSVNFGGTKAGQFGTGVRGETLARIRDLMIDQQYRDESVKNAFYATKEAAFGRMEDIINEPSENGLAKSLDLFWASLQDLSVNPDDTGARSVVRQRALTLAQTFNYMSSSLTKVQDDLKTEAGVVTKKINDLLTKISDVNRQIGDAEPLGVLPNELYDERDRYMDELSQYIEFERVPVDYTNGETRGNSQRVAEGRIDIRVVVGGTEVKLVDGLSGGVGKFDGMTMTDAAGTNTSMTHADMPNGKWKALVEMYGSATGPEAIDGAFTNMLKDLDEMANVFASAFNVAHGTNMDADGNAGRTDFFVGTTSAATITVNPDFMKNLDLIAASKDGNIGDGSGALELAQLKESALNFAGSVTTSTSIGKYYQNVIGNMAVEASQNANLAKSTFALLSSSDQRRLSVSAVSLDEEMTMMIQYQHAYNAAARNITAVDEMLDKIINGMGVVGR